MKRIKKEKSEERRETRKSGCAVSGACFQWIAYVFVQSFFCSFPFFALREVGQPVGGREEGKYGQTKSEEGKETRNEMSET